MKVTINPNHGVVGKVVVRPINRTSISSPNFNPTPNVSISDIQQVNVSVRKDGDTLIYNANTGTYISSPIVDAQIDLKNINGGRF